MQSSLPTIAIASADMNLCGALSAVLSRSFSVVQDAALEQGDIIGWLEKAQPQVLLYDWRSPSPFGANHEAFRRVPVLVLGPDTPESMIEAVEAGAMGYIAGDAPLREIETAAIQVAQGKAVIPPFMLGSLLHHVVRQRRAENSARQQLDILTSRESEVFDLAALGLSQDEIGERLYISPATARTHLHRIFKKLDIHSRAELVALAAACGLPTTEES